MTGVSCTSYRTWTSLLLRLLITKFSDLTSCAKSKKIILRIIFFFGLALLQVSKGKCFIKPTSIIHNLDKSSADIYENKFRNVRNPAGKRKRKIISKLKSFSHFCQFKIEHEKMNCLERIEDTLIFKKRSKLDSSKKTK